MKALEYYNAHGYYIVTSPGQQEEVDELVQQGLLHKAKPEWFAKGKELERVYVHVSVDCKEKMPASLHKVVFPLSTNFFEGEFVFADFRSVEGKDICVLAKINRKLPKNRYEISVVSSFDCLYVDEGNLRRTFRMD